MAEFFDDKSAKRIARAVQHFERTHRNPRGRRARWQQHRERVRFAWATVMSGSGYSNVATTDTTFEVTDVVPFDGRPFTGDDPLEVSNDPDEYEIAAGATGKIVFCKDATGDTWSWHPLDFPCV